MQCSVLTYSPVKFWLRIDDSMDVFAEHGVAGILGLIANALFGASYIIGLDGVNTDVIIGGFPDQNWKQLYIQIAYIVACTGYSFVMALIIAYAINYIPGLHLRASEEAELLGMDDDQLGEFAYDYVEVRRDYLAWTPAKASPHDGSHNIPQNERHGIGQHGDMLIGKDPSENSSSGEDHAGKEHIGIGGDRHAVGLDEKQHA